METFDFKVSGTVSIKAKDQQEANEKLNKILIEFEKINVKLGGKLVA